MLRLEEPWCEYRVFQAAPRLRGASSMPPHHLNDRRTERKLIPRGLLLRFGRSCGDGAVDLIDVDVGELTVAVIEDQLSSRLERWMSLLQLAYVNFDSRHEAICPRIPV